MVHENEKTYTASFFGSPSGTTMTVEAHGKHLVAQIGSETSIGAKPLAAMKATLVGPLFVIVDIVLLEMMAPVFILSSLNHPK